MVDWFWKHRVQVYVVNFGHILKAIFENRAIFIGSCVNTITFDRVSFRLATLDKVCQEWGHMRQSGVARLKFNGVELCRNSIKNSSSADPYLAQVELITSIEFPHCLYKISIWPSCSAKVTAVYIWCVRNVYRLTFANRIIISQNKQEKILTD